MVRAVLRGVLVAAVAAVALPIVGAQSASGDAVIGSVTDLGVHDIDVNGTASPVMFMNESFGPRYLYMTSIATAAVDSNGRSPRYVTAVDPTTGTFVQDWPLPDDTMPTDPVVADGDTVWVSTLKDTQLFKVGDSAPIADFPDTWGVAVVGKRAYVLGAGSNVPELAVIDDDPSSSGYLTQIDASADLPVTDGPLVAGAAAGGRLFLSAGGVVYAIDADPASANYLKVTGSAATAAGSNSFAPIVTDALGDRVLTPDRDDAAELFGVTADGQLASDGTLTVCTTDCNGVTATMSPDGRLAYVVSGNADRVQAYDLTTPTHPEVGAIDALQGTDAFVPAVSPDGTELTTGGTDPKIATVAGFVTTPTISGPVLPLPGDTLSVNTGYWSGTPTWQWLRDGRPIPGTVGASTYSVTKADLGTKLTVSATLADVGTRTSAPVAVAAAPRITATVTGWRDRNGWYRGPVSVTFSCLRGSAPIVRCPSAVRLHQGANEAVSGTVADRNGLTATATVARLDVCNRCVVGAAYVDGHWRMRPGVSYPVVLVGGQHPWLVRVSRFGHPGAFRPAHARRLADIAGEPVWTFRLRAPTARGKWLMAYREGGRTGWMTVTVR